MIDISTPFIKRPVGTTLLATGLFLLGIVAYWILPIASLPAVDLPNIRVSAGRPGADPATMAASVAAPLERRLGTIAGVSEITSTSTLGSTNISIQFEAGRKSDSAARDVQAALNAAATDLPADLPTLPVFRKANPNAFPVMVLALTSDTIPASTIFDAADTILAQRLSQISGVAEVNVTGSEQPAIRIRVDPARVASMGLSLDAIRATIQAANVQSPVGSFDGAMHNETIGVNDQLNTPQEFGRIIISSKNGVVVRLSDVASVERGVKNTRAAGWYNGRPSVIVQITKQPDANVIETVDRVKAQIPEIKNWLPAGVVVSVLSDRTLTIRSSLADLKHTLLITIALVMMVIFVFLRRGVQTLAAGVTVPLSLAGTFVGMWLVGFTIDNLSLMAITISIGFVVDDAIVMIENIHRNMEAGIGRMEAAIIGARQIAFTIVSISLSLVSIFLPLLFWPGLVGKFIQEFAWTLSFAILVSTIISLTVTPMICAHFMKSEAQIKPSWLDGFMEKLLTRIVAFYSRTLQSALNHPKLMLVEILVTVALTVVLAIYVPKGFLPQDDTGLVFASTESSPDISFAAMANLQKQAEDIVLKDPAVQGTASSIGNAAFGGTVNQGRLFINLKPENERKMSSTKVVQRLRKSLSGIAGLRVFMVPVQDLRAGGRSSKAQYQFTLWDPNFEELTTWAPKVLERVRNVKGAVDVSTDREQGGLEARLVINRAEASRLGVAIADIDNALFNSFGQRQISTLYGQRNQYRVVYEITPDRATDPTDMANVYVKSNTGAMIPLSALARIERGINALVVNHQGQFPSITITYNIEEGAGVDATLKAIQSAVADMHLPDELRTEFAGDAKAFQDNSGTIVLVLAAILSVYIILGVLYESLIHPLTIISTLPSGILGGLAALMIAGTELNIIATIAILLLIGIVKKNGIMLVDFAINAERERGLSPKDAIYQACLERFRPILMTTMAALLGAIPLAVATGSGAELRRPLGITIVGGLVLSQVLTLYSTPVIYLLMSKLGRKKRVASSE
jgi:hydrophobe/amphiphile efflux-1 (HAE1) family protein